MYMYCKIPFMSDGGLVLLCIFRTLQVFGGAGYNSEYPVEKLMRDAKIFQVTQLIFYNNQCLF